MTGAERLRVLVLEDYADDADLAVLELRRGGFEVEWTRVEVEADFRAALQEDRFDLVLADYNLPDIDARAALEVLRELAPDVPFIIVSGSIGEDTAVAAMQLGAADYILKDRLARLSQAVRRALDRARDRRQREEAEERLRQLELREAQNRLEQAEVARSQAEAASASKSDFLNLAAHELRTPLSVLNGYVSLLLDGSLGAPSESWVETIRIMQDKAAELNRLVDSLLQAARLGAQADAGEPEELDLAEAAREAINRAGARARLHGASLSFSGPPGPVMVYANGIQVSRILDNLIDNAMTYSDQAPCVSVSVGPGGTIDVEDHGRGVPEADREAIFERFHRVHDASRTSPPGAGLGLYIARELAQRYGGSLELVASSLGEGSSFRLSLPAAPADDVWAAMSGAETTA